MAFSSSARFFYQRISTTTKKSLPIQGIIFDMDGTLTIPVLKFRELRERLGISDTIDILEYANNASDADKPNIYKIIEDFEEEGNEKLRLKPSIHNLFYFLKEQSLKTALLTRNNRKSVDSFMGKFVNKDDKSIFQREADIFSKVVTRDFLPTKPHPAAIHHICESWQTPTETVLMVGDDWTDVECGNQAGAVTVLMVTPSNGDIRDKADLCINDLSELIVLLKSNFNVTKH